jgi:hypothetical protein
MHAANADAGGGGAADRQSFALGAGAIGPSELLDPPPKRLRLTAEKTDNGLLLLLLSPPLLQMTGIASAKHSHRKPNDSRINSTNYALVRICDVWACGLETAAAAVAAEYSSRTAGCCRWAMCNTRKDCTLHRRIHRSSIIYADIPNRL